LLPREWKEKSLLQSFLAKDEDDDGSPADITTSMLMDDSSGEQTRPTSQMNTYRVFLDDPKWCSAAIATDDTVCTIVSSTIQFRNSNCSKT
jgi:hypothetical protein